MTETSAKKTGRPFVQISDRDLEQIEMLAGIGVNEANIAMVMGFSQKTLQRRKKDSERVRQAIELGKAKAEAKVAQSLYNLAVVDHNLSAIIWYEKTRCGRSDRSHIEIIQAVESQMEQMLDRLQAVMEPDEYTNLLNYLASLEAGEATDTASEE